MRGNIRKTHQYIQILENNGELEPLTDEEEMKLSIARRYRKKLAQVLFTNVM